MLASGETQLLLILPECSGVSRAFLVCLFWLLFLQLCHHHGHPRGSLLLPSAFLFQPSPHSLCPHSQGVCSCFQNIPDIFSCNLPPDCPSAFLAAC